MPTNFGVIPNERLSKADIACQGQLTFPVFHRDFSDPMASWTGPKHSDMKIMKWPQRSSWVTSLANNGERFGLVLIAWLWMWLSNFPGHVGSSLGFCCTDGVAVLQCSPEKPIQCSQQFQYVRVCSSGQSDSSKLPAFPADHSSCPILSSAPPWHQGLVTCFAPVETDVSWCLLMFPWPNSTRGRCNTMEVRQIWRRWRPMHWSLALKGSPFLFHFYQHRRTVHLNKQKDNITNIL